MGLVGRMIDRLTDRQRDRILRASIEDWHPDGTEWLDGEGRRCLFGHAFGAVRVLGPGAAIVTHGREADAEAGLAVQSTQDWRSWCAPHAQTGEWSVRSVNAPTKFPVLVRRFGLRRVVRACKLRAARGNGTAPSRRPAVAFRGGRG